MNFCENYQAEPEGAEEFYRQYQLIFFFLPAICDILLSMIPIKRIEMIKKVLSSDKQADVSTLAAHLNVTEATIRRDLEKLENENFLTRTHGGAIINEQKNVDISLFHLENIDTQPYEEIGSIASHIVEDNTMIFLGPGISSRFIARELNSKKNLTVITTDLMVAHDCALYSPNVAITTTGGRLNTTTLQLSGYITNNELSSYFFNAAFFDIDGLTMTRGYSVSSMEKYSLIKSVSGLTKNSFLVFPFTIFNTESAVVLGTLDMCSTVITNGHIPDVYKKYCFDHNIKIYETIRI
jgi:Transcriptional regulators of sugar metabolism